MPTDTERIDWLGENALSSEHRLTVGLGDPLSGDRVSLVVCKGLTRIGPRWREYTGVDVRAAIDAAMKEG